MEKTVIHSTNAPAAIGPYSQAIQVANVIYTSGQIGLDPSSGQLISEDIAVQARQAFANLSAVLKAANADLQQIVKLTLYLTDLSHFAKINSLMAELIPSPFPARSTVGVASLPKGALFEVEAIAIV